MTGNCVLATAKKPSVDMVSPLIKSASFYNETNSLKVFFDAIGLFFLKLVMLW
ncbi:hypothetical protein [Flavobacterium sp. LS2R12]|uniref:hypothetical protein n=1 Tax=unclassified Flavobacterium TaxID=196869 RepID=UPI003AABB589